MNLLSIFLPKPRVIHEVRYVAATRRESAKARAIKDATTAKLRAELAARELAKRAE